PIPAPSPTPLYSKLRIFVASESTDQVWVLDGKPGEPYALAGKIAVGKLPHQLGVSPDGKWVAVNNRMGNTTSIIDPFAMKEVDQDGVFFMADRSLMVLSDHLGPGLLWVDWKERRVLSETKLGQQPFHTTYDPEGDRLLTTTNVDGMVNVIDVKTRAVVQKVSVPK